MLSHTEERYLEMFVDESNKIENILRPPQPHEINATRDFIQLPKLTVADVSNLVNALAPGKALRSRLGMNVTVGGFKCMSGGQAVEENLKDLLKLINAEKIDPWKAHMEYEIMHPYMDGNGRSGRAIWLWQMRRYRTADQVANGMLHHYTPLNFLRSFYYQSLAGYRLIVKGQTPDADL